MSRTIANIQANIDAVVATMDALERRNKARPTDLLYWRLDDKLTDLIEERIQAGGSYPAGEVAIIEE